MTDKFKEVFCSDKDHDIRHCLRSEVGNPFRFIAMCVMEHLEVTGLHLWMLKEIILSYVEDFKEG